MGCRGSKQKVTPKDISISVEGSIPSVQSPPSTSHKHLKGKGTTSTLCGRQTRAGTDPNCQGQIMSNKTYIVFLYFINRIAIANSVSIVSPSTTTTTASYNRKSLAMKSNDCHKSGAAGELKLCLSKKSMPFYRSGTTPEPKYSLKRTLKDSVLAHRFQAYLKEKYNPKDPSTFDYLVYYNCYNFWLEAADFCTLPRSEFKTSRANEINNRYIVYSAPCPIPIEQAEREEINDILLSNEIPSSDLFRCFQDEIFYFMSNDIYPQFMSLLEATPEESSNNAFLYNYEARKRYENTLDKNQTSIDANSKRAKLEGILTSSRKCFYFKKYLTRLDAVDNLNFYLAVADFTALFCNPLRVEYVRTSIARSRCSTNSIHSRISMNNCNEGSSSPLVKPYKIEDSGGGLGDDLIGGTPTHKNILPPIITKKNMSLKQLNKMSNNNGVSDLDKILNREFFLSEASEIYHKYIRNGGDNQVIDDYHLQDDIVNQLSTWNENDNTYPYKAFDKASDFIFNLIMNNFVDAFFQSQEYKDFLNERNTRDMKKTQMINVKELAEITGAKLFTLPEIIHNRPLCQLFENFLVNSVNKNLVLFINEVIDFNTIPRSQILYKMGRARKIYTKYIQRGTKLEIPLEESFKRGVCRKIGLTENCNDSLFQPIVQECYAILETEEYNTFILSNEYRQYIANLEENEDKIELKKHEACTVSFIDILREPSYNRYFKDYLSSQYIEANIFFWVDVEEYKRTPTSQYSLNRANKIYTRYISAEARQPVCITNEVKEKVKKSVEEKDNNPNIFNSAQLEIEEFMKSLFPTFQQSDFYPKLLEEIKSGDKKTNARRFTVYDTTEETEACTSVAECVKHPIGCNYLKLYCERMNMNSNLLFYLEVEEYSLIPAHGLLRVKAKKIYSKYLVENAKLPISVKNSLTPDQIDNPTPNMFLTLQKEVLQFMETKIFPDFVKSAEYANYKQFLDENRKKD